MPKPAARIVLNTFGSLGDLHPYLALAIGLRARGHHISVASSEVYRTKIEAEGFAFHAVRPNAGDLLKQPGLMAKLLDQRNGTDFLLRDYLIPRVREGFEDLLPLCRGADLLITHMAGFAGPIVADVLGLRWMSVALQPAAMFSRYDTLVVSKAPWLRHFYFLGPKFTGLLLKLADRETRRWARPIEELRRELGLKVDRNPIMHGQYSPYGTLVLFSRHFAAPQPDWPPGAAQAGFLFYDALGSGMPGGSPQEENLSRLEAFLAEGPPPVMFTLGSSAVMQAGDFYSESMKAASKLNLRAILLVGKEGQTRFSENQSGVFVADYLPYSAVMPKVAACVHAGGIGSTAQALRAGCPALVVPWSNDQPDNAYRAQRLRVARVLPRTRYQARTAARQLAALLDRPQIRETASQISTAIQAEDSLKKACDAVESVL